MDILTILLIIILVINIAGIHHERRQRKAWEMLLDDLYEMGMFQESEIALNKIRRELGIKETNHHGNME